MQTIEKTNSAQIHVNTKLLAKFCVVWNRPNLLSPLDAFAFVKRHDNLQTWKCFR